ncbi:hypothetical protein [Endozoicomonas acroporae]|uniref:hypothetical protein n=1 Tax=Endozoicomonas acroporae TaxID=1701104 RepID=UPI0013D74FAF|nr:hypothetical protein [Endozoicomonas acroporae]
MNDLTKNYTYYLKIFYSDVEEECVYKIRSNEVERFKINLETTNDKRDSYPFFVCNTMDGKTAGVNLREVQAVHILWEPSHLPEDTTHFDGIITIKLKGRKDVIKCNSDTPEELSELFNVIQLSPDAMGVFVSFTDEDGEEILINRNELIYIEAPTDLVNEGDKIIEEEKDQC